MPVPNSQGELPPEHLWKKSKWKAWGLEDREFKSSCLQNPMTPDLLKHLNKGVSIQSEIIQRFFSSLRHPLQEANLHSSSDGLSSRFLDGFQKYLWCHWLGSAANSLGLSDWNTGCPIPGFLLARKHQSPKSTDFNVSENWPQISALSRTACQPWADFLDSEPVSNLVVCGGEWMKYWF